MEKLYETVGVHPVYQLDMELGVVPTLRDGVYKVMGCGGRVTQVISTQGGQLHGVQERYRNGRLLQRREYMHGLLDGWQSDYSYGTNVPEFLEEWRSGLFTGNRESYYYDGTLATRCTVSPQAKIIAVREQWYSNGARCLVTLYTAKGLERELRYDRAGELVLDSYVHPGRALSAREFNLHSFIEESCINAETMALISTDDIIRMEGSDEGRTTYARLTELALELDRKG